MREIPLRAIEEAALAIYDPVVRTPVVPLPPASHPRFAQSGRIRGKIVAIVSGGNIDLPLFASLCEDAQSSR